jgi:hypothetical protein
VALLTEHLELIETPIVRLLLLDGLPDRGLITAYGGHIVSAGPKVLAREVLPSPQGGPRNGDGALPLDEPEDLGHRVLRGDGQQHVDMVEVEMALFHQDLALPGQLPQHWPEVFAAFPVPGLAPIVGDPDPMGPCTPTWRGLSSRCRPWKPPGDRVSFERFTAQEAFVFSRNCQTLGVARQSRGVT